MPICTIYIVNTGTQWCKHFYQTSVHKPVKYAAAPCRSLRHTSWAPHRRPVRPGLRVGCHSPLDQLFGYGLAEIAKVTVGLLPDAQRHGHNTSLLYPSVLRAGARRSGCLLLCSAVHTLLPTKSSSCISSSTCFSAACPCLGRRLVCTCFRLEHSWNKQPRLMQGWDITFRIHNTQT